MNKLKLSMAAAGLAIVAATAAYAQSGPAPRGEQTMTREGGRWHMAALNQDEFRSLVDARIAGLQAGLRLTDAQRPLWAPVEKALRDTAQTRYDAMQAFRAERQQATPDARPDFMARMERRAAMMDQRAEGLKTLNTALKPLWASLDERQKNVLPMLMRQAVGGGEGGMKRGDRDGQRGPMQRGEHEGHDGHRFGMMGQGMMGHGMMGHGMMGGHAQPTAFTASPFDDEEI
jgi:hypothetical protein